MSLSKLKEAKDKALRIIPITITASIFTIGFASLALTMNDGSYEVEAVDFDQRIEIVMDENEITGDDLNNILSDLSSKYGSEQLEDTAGIAGSPEEILESILDKHPEYILDVENYFQNNSNSI